MEILEVRYKVTIAAFVSSSHWQTYGIVTARPNDAVLTCFVTLLRWKCCWQASPSIRYQFYSAIGVSR
jgi:hypothetical protein